MHACDHTGMAIGIIVQYPHARLGMRARYRSITRTCWEAPRRAAQMLQFWTKRHMCTRGMCTASANTNTYPTHTIVTTHSDEQTSNVTNAFRQ